MNLIVSLGLFIVTSGVLVALFVIGNLRTIYRRHPNGLPRALASSPLVMLLVAGIAASRLEDSQAVLMFLLGCAVNMVVIIMIGFRLRKLGSGVIAVLDSKDCK